MNVPWNPRLAHLRAVAALLVLGFHVYHHFLGQWQPRPWAWWAGAVVEGHTGVSLFFVLSGFLFMTIAQHAHGPLAYGAFVRNRVLRIFPLFAVVFMVAVSIGRDAFRPQDVLYLAFSNLGQAPTSNQFITGAAWTVSVEFTFYLVFPFLARFALEQGPGYLLRLAGLLLLLKLGAFLVSERPTHMIYSTLLGRMDQFLVGMAAAQWAAGRWQGRAVLHGGWALLAALAMWALLGAQARWASYFLPQPAQWAWVAWPTLEALGWAGVIVAYAHWRGAPWPGLARWLERCGEISFSLYLWHGLVIYLLGRALQAAGAAQPALWPGGPWPAALALWALALALSWAVASLSYRTVEAPFLALRGRYA